MTQFTPRAPPGANESNFIAVPVLISAEQIKYQSAKAWVIQEVIPE